MTDEPTRSEQLFKTCQRHTLALSALHRLRDMFREIEPGRATDRRLAWIGFVALPLVA